MSRSNANLIGLAFFAALLGIGLIVGGSFAIVKSPDKSVFCQDWALTSKYFGQKCVLSTTDPLSPSCSEPCVCRDITFKASCLDYPISITTKTWGGVIISCGIVLIFSVGVFVMAEVYKQCKIKSTVIH